MTRILFVLILLVPSLASAVTRNQKAMLTGGDMSANITSSAVDVYPYLTVSCQAVWVGTAPTGSLQLQISDDASTSPGNWSNFGSPDAITTSGSYVWNLSDVGYRWIRAVYTFTSGTGTMNINCTEKGT